MHATPEQITNLKCSADKKPLLDTLKHRPDLCMSWWMVVSHTDGQGSIPTRFIHRDFTWLYLIASNLRFIQLLEIQSVNQWIKKSLSDFYLNLSSVNTSAPHVVTWRPRPPYARKEPLHGRTKQKISVRVNILFEFCVKVHLCYWLVLRQLRSLYAIKWAVRIRSDWNV